MRSKYIRDLSASAAAGRLPVMLEQLREDRLFVEREDGQRFRAQVVAPREVLDEAVGIGEIAPTLHLDRRERRRLAEMLTEVPLRGVVVLRALAKAHDLYLVEQPRFGHEHEELERERAAFLDERARFECVVAHDPNLPRRREAQRRIVRRRKCKRSCRRGSGTLAYRTPND